ncbi:MAG: glutathione S-transferase N-terminal domain-containing protein [Pseudomonadota bacterium]
MNSGLSDGAAPEMDQPLELWTFATPNGWKVSIMIEELREAGVRLPEVDVRVVDIMRGDQFGEEFTALNPNQRIPALAHGNVKLMESCAILLYLGETFPTPLLPQGDGHWDAVQWVFWQAANVGPAFGNKLSYTRYLADLPEEQRRHPLERFGGEAQRLLGVLDRQLQDQSFICGDVFTVADIACFPWVRGWKWSKIDITGHSNVVRWLKSVRARPGVDRGLTYGAPPGETDQWSEKTKARYASGGALMAANRREEPGG